MTISWFEDLLNIETNEYDMFNGNIYCEWFDDKELKGEKFSQESLELNPE